MNPTDLIGKQLAVIFSPQDNLETGRIAVIAGTVEDRNGTLVLRRNTGLVSVPLRSEWLGELRARIPWFFPTVAPPLDAWVSATVKTLPDAPDYWIQPGSLPARPGRS